MIILQDQNFDLEVTTSKHGHVKIISEMGAVIIERENIQKLAEVLMREIMKGPGIRVACSDCGYTHRAEQRLDNKCPKCKSPWIGAVK